MSDAETDRIIRELEDQRKDIQRLDRMIANLTAKAPEPLRHYGTWPNKAVTAAEWNEAFAPDAGEPLGR